MQEVHLRIAEHRAKEQTASEHLARLKDSLIEQSQRRAALEKELVKCKYLGCNCVLVMISRDLPQLCRRLFDNRCEGR